MVLVKRKGIGRTCEGGLCQKEGTGVKGTRRGPVMRVEMERVREGAERTQKGMVMEDGDGAVLTLGPFFRCISASHRQT